MTIKLQSKSRALYDHFAYFRNSWNLFEYIFSFHFESFNLDFLSIENVFQAINK